ncbi:MAG: hypothetical protein LBP62_03105 [Clostridiales bacterium]|jgi:hypothetical protein|nr:hypothetical protein [Clostridiales bacterium]
MKNIKKETIMYAVLTALFLILFAAALGISMITDYNSPLVRLADFLLMNPYVIWLLGIATVVFGINTAASAVNKK